MLHPDQHPMKWLRKWWGAVIAALVAVLYFVLRQRTDAQKVADAAEAQLEVEREERHERERLQGLRDTERARHEAAVAKLVSEAKANAVETAKLEAKVDLVADGGETGAKALAGLLGSE